MISLLKKQHIIFFLCILCIIPLAGFAAGDNSDSGGGVITNVTQVNTILGNLVKWMYDIFWIITVGFIIWAAYLFLSAGDNTEQVEKARKMLLYAVIAAAVVLIANGVEALVANLIST